MNIVHPCLRMGCSKLNAHLKNNLNVIDYESGRCGYPAEDVQHFFFFLAHCMTLLQTSSLNTVQAVSNVEVSLKLLLFGSNNLSVDQNLIIIDAVHFSTSLGVS